MTRIAYVVWTACEHITQVSTNCVWLDDITPHILHISLYKSLLASSSTAPLAPLLDGNSAEVFELIMPGLRGCSSALSCGTA